MFVFENTEIPEKQPWQGQVLRFDPDSSPAAWEHYRRYYSEIFRQYSIDSPTFFTYRHPNKYVPEPSDEKTCFNRLYALVRGAAKGPDGYYAAELRLSGDTDFNFKEETCGRLRKILKDEPEYLSKLAVCQDQHHRLINFSLMQTVGKMQQFKGRGPNDRGYEDGYDRLDRFLYHLGNFYDTPLEERLHTAVSRYATASNRECLTEFLNQFDNLMDYCRKVYLIDDADLVQSLRENGKRELDTVEAVKTYLDLALRFWEKKEFYLSKQEYLTVGSYFLNGAEIYTEKELSRKLADDLGIIDPKEVGIIIQKCLDRGFIIDCGNNCYTR